MSVAVVAGMANVMFVVGFEVFVFGRVRAMGRQVELDVRMVLVVVPEVERPPRHEPEQHEEPREERADAAAAGQGRHPSRTLAVRMDGVKVRSLTSGGLSPRAWARRIDAGARMSAVVRWDGLDPRHACAASPAHALALTGRGSLGFQIGLREVISNADLACEQA